MKKVIILLLIIAMFCLIPKQNVYAGMQPLTPKNVKKVITTKATRSEFCRLKIGDTDVSDFSKNSLQGLGSPGQDEYITTLDKMKCTEDNKEIIYGTLAITRNIPTEDVVYEQVFVIDGHYLRPTNVYNEFYVLYPEAPQDPDTHNSIRGIFKDLSVTKGSLKRISDVETENYSGEDYNTGDREFAYLVHVNTDGIINNIYVLYQGGIYKYKETLKEIEDVLLVDYNINEPQTPTPNSDPTANWKIFTTSDNHYSIKYPSDVLRNSNEICPNAPKISTYLKLFVIDEKLMKEDPSLFCGSAIPVQFEIQQVDKFVIPKTDEYYDVTESEVVIGGLPGRKYVSIRNSKPTGGTESPINKSVHVNIETGSKKLMIYYGFPSIIPEQTFDQIISTLKFTDSNAMDTSSWRTYEGDGFSFKYPPDISLDPNNKNAMIVSKSPSAIEFYVLTETMQKIVDQSEGLKSNEQIIMGGISGVKITGSEGIAGTVRYIKGFVEKNNKTYYLGFSTQDTELFNNFSPKFDQILSTFKFSN